jgi:hypothetical protein
LGDSGVVEPAADLLGVKADELAELEIGDATFRDETADVAGARAEAFDELVDGQQVGECVGSGHVCFLLAGATSYGPAFGRWRKVLLLTGPGRPNCARSGTSLLVFLENARYTASTGWDPQGLVAGTRNLESHEAPTVGSEGSFAPTGVRACREQGVAGRTWLGPRVRRSMSASSV